MLAPGEKKTHRGYVWAYCSTPFSSLKAVVYDFSPSRAGEHARNFLGQWNGQLVCDDFAGYKASFLQGITKIGSMAHAHRKFFDLHATNKSQLAEQALHSIGGLYEVERQARDMTDEDRWTALTRYIDDGAVPIDNTPCENQILPCALGRSNGLFAGSLRSGKRAAACIPQPHRPPGETFVQGEAFPMLCCRNIETVRNKLNGH